MNKLNVCGLNEMVDKTPIKGLCLVQSYSKQPTKNGGFFIGGVLSTDEGTVDFKAWSKSLAFKLLDCNELKGCIVNIEGEVNEFGSTKSVIISYVSVLNSEKIEEMGIVETDFMYSKYNVSAYYTKFVGTMEKNLSENCMKVFNAVMEKYGDRFKEEFAAMHHHDNCKGGLLAHSLKVCQVASIVSLYPSILDWVGKDLLYLGCALHDLGKVSEYSLGDISEEGKTLSHLVMGPIILATEFEEIICSELGDRFFYELLSVLSSHHGEHGEPPRTVAAYVIHKLDMLESIFSSLNDHLVDAKKGDVQQFDGFKLS